jgi:hypothetical protein
LNPYIPGHVRFFNQGADSLVKNEILILGLIESFYPLKFDRTTFRVAIAIIAKDKNPQKQKLPSGVNSNSR